LVGTGRARAAADADAAAGLPVPTVPRGFDKLNLRMVTAAFPAGLDGGGRSATRAGTPSQVPDRDVMT